MKKTIPASILIILLASLTFIIVSNVAVVKATGITRVQGNARAVTTTTTLTITQTSNATEGNLLILCFGSAKGSSTYSLISGITQTGVTWTQQAQSTYMYSTYGQNSEIWAGVVGAGAARTITITLDNAPGAYGAVGDVCEYSGLLTSGFLDKTASNSGYSNTPDTGTTATTSNADQLWIGATQVFWIANAPAQSLPTNNFTLLDGAAANSVSLAYLEKMPDAVGAANTGTTIAAGVNCWTGCIATFLTSTPEPTPTPTPTATPDGYNKTVNGLNIGDIEGVPRSKVGAVDGVG